MSAIELLSQYRNWVCWKLEERNGKPTKVPKNPNTGSNAASNNPKTWASYKDATLACGAVPFDGIGFMLNPDVVKLVGVDLDHCLDNGTPKPWAQDIITTLNSYTEITPSGNGLRVFLFGDLPPKGRKNGRIELYTSGRFLTVTGNHLAGTPDEIKHREAEILSVHRQVFGERQEPKPAQPSTPTNLDDRALLDLAKSAANGAKFSDLWAGNATAYPSASEADLALCEMLAFWTGGDPGQIDRLFKSSGLMRDKWGEVHNSAGQTYGQLTIAKALDLQTEYYTPPAVTPPPPEPPPFEATGPDPDENLSALFPHFTLSEGLALPEADYLIYGAIQRGDIGMTYGDAAAGKTYLSIDQAVSLAAGWPWMGRWEVKRAFKVVYFIAEGKRAFFRRILAAVNGMAERGADVKEVYRLVNENLAIVTEVPQLFEAEAARHVIHYVDLWQQMGRPAVDMVYIDTLHRASVGSEENSSKDAGIVVEAVSWLQKQLDCAVNFVHHSNKGGGYRGSTAYRGNVDYVFKVEGAHREPRTLTIDKLRDGEPDGPIEGIPYMARFKVDESSRGTYAKWLSETEAQEYVPKRNLSKREMAKSEIKEVLAVEPNLSKNQLAKRVTCASDNTATAALEEMISKGEVLTTDGVRNSIQCYLPNFG